MRPPKHPPATPEVLATFARLCDLLDTLRINTTYYRDERAISLSIEERIAGVLEDVATFNRRVELLGIGHPRSISARLAALEERIATPTTDGGVRCGSTSAGGMS